MTRGRLVCAENSNVIGGLDSGRPQARFESWLPQPAEAADSGTPAAAATAKAINNPAKVKLLVTFRIRYSRDNSQPLRIPAHAVNRLVGAKTSPTRLL